MALGCKVYERKFYKFTTKVFAKNSLGQVFIPWILSKEIKPNLIAVII